MTCGVNVNLSTSCTLQSSLQLARTFNKHNGLQQSNYDFIKLIFTDPKSKFFYYEDTITGV